MTRLFGLIGSPIDHSLSPLMQTAAFRALRLDALYTAVEVPRHFLHPILRSLMLAGVEGLNVTVPLKEAVIPLLDRVDPTARTVGAVNTIVIRNRLTIGYNTDGRGFVLALKELGWRQKSTRALLLGAGGAARAVAWELARIAGSDLTIANRRLVRGQRLARWVARQHPRARVRAVSLREVQLEGIELVVNATTVGMHPGDGAPVDSRGLHRGMMVYDLVYHRETPLVQAARRRGCIAANGLSMLLYQGAESFRLWLHRTPPIDAMRTSLTHALRGGRAG